MNSLRKAVENVKKTHGTQWKPSDNCQDFVQRVVDEYFRLQKEELMKQQKLKEEQKKLKPAA